jgi:hypothetical protein
MTPLRQGTELTAQLIGNDWQALQTSGDNGATWNSLSARTNHSGATTVKMWLKGVTITGRVTATDGDELETYPNLKGPTADYRMGLIQIITEDPIMVARYEGPSYKRDRQRTIPVFDSEGVGVSPWYTRDTRANLQNNLASEVELRDYPVTIANLRFDSTLQAGRLLELRKCLVFRVYLAVAPKTAAYKQAGMRILKYLAWTADTHLQFTWNPDGSFSYEAKIFKRTVDNVVDVMDNPANSLALIRGFPLSAEGANSTIGCTDLR